MSAADRFADAGDRVKAALGRRQATPASWAAPVETTVEQARVRKFGRLKKTDVAWVCEQLAVTQEAGLPLYRALGLLVSMKKGTGLGARISWMQGQLSEGRSLAAVFAEQEREWGSLVVALVAAGEASGNLGAAFARASDLVQTQLRLRRKLRTALTYPSVVIAVTGVLIATMLLVVVPRFQEIYASLGSELPEVTRFVITLSNQMPLVVAVTGALVFAGVLVWRRSRHDRNLKRHIDKALLRIPVIGLLLEKGVQSRVASTLGILLAAGVPLLEVLGYAAATSGSVPKEDALAQVRRDLADGATFSDSLEATGEFPELMVQLAAVGEESGSLPEMMQKYAARTTEEVEQVTTTLTSLVEPLMMVMVGVVVGVFLLALYMPIISLSSAIR